MITHSKDLALVCGHRLVGGLAVVVSVFNRTWQSENGLPCYGSDLAYLIDEVGEDGLFDNDSMAWLEQLFNDMRGKFAAVPVVLYTSINQRQSKAHIDALHVLEQRDVWYMITRYEARQAKSA